MFRSRRLVVSLGVAVIVMIIVSFVDLPFLNVLFEPNFTSVEKMK
jgi:hypothetical protein